MAPIKQAKGHLIQSFIDMAKFDVRDLDSKKELFKGLMGHLTQTLDGVKKARRSQKLNLEIDTSNRPPVDRNFWDDLVQFAKSIGIDVIGFTEVDEYFIFEKEMTKYRVKDSVLDNAIMLGMEMKKEAISQAPEAPAGMEAMRIYAELGIATNKLANYLRERGFQAQAFHPFGGPVLYPPMAEKAGLGEIGNNGLLITREFGPSLRLSMIATDATPLPESDQISLGIKEYCKNCGLCVENCPTQAIFPLDQKRTSSDGKYLTSIDNAKCFPQFFKTFGCSVCIKVCPFFKVGYKTIAAKLMG